MRFHWGRFAGCPPLPPRLGATLLLALAAGLNLYFQAEIWPHTPGARLLWCGVLWVAGVLLGPLLLMTGWGWLRAYEGPALLRLVLTATYLGGASLGLLGWLLWLLGGVVGLSLWGS